MNYTNVINPQWATVDHSSINCTVIFEQCGETPFTANPNDPENHGSEIFNDCVAGKYGVVAEYVPPAPYIATSEWNKTMAVQLLANTDWVNQPDVTNTSNTPHLLNQAEFVAYRNTIRAIAVNPPSGNLTWATEPIAQWSQ
jgi:hypothetical protein